MDPWIYGSAAGAAARPAAGAAAACIYYVIKGHVLTQELSKMFNIRTFCLKVLMLATKILTPKFLFSAPILPSAYTGALCAPV